MKRSTTSNTQPPKKKQKHTAGTGSTITQKYPIVTHTDNKQRDLFVALSKRKMLPNRYVDLSSLSLLKITNFQSMLDEIGWSDLMHMDEPSYKTLTCEFLSSFRVIDENTLSFRIANVQHELTKDELADMFGWKLIEQQVLPHNYATPFWLEITGLPSNTKYVPRLAASSAILSYSLRYFARLMSFTMYGRDEGNNKIQKDELVLLYHFDEGLPVDWTNLLISRFLYQATRDRGALVMGGFVTRIAKRLGVFDCSKTNLKRVDGWPATIDVNYLLGMHMVRPDTLGKGLTRVPPTRSSVQMETQAPEPTLSLKEQVSKLRQSQASILKGQAELQKSFKQLLQNQDKLEKQITDMFDFIKQHYSHQPS
ncbi:hypothetical protein POM88_021629 [Heracleum sosnowskyi]|uniref:Arabidopsis retrotransposon Orf1 C-terminal domain-containing protein n=1 Tax=Heracleum sosnowskyi TaxID=360622 RepID=A0AAD8IF80_9APIA|nr:hypothetical protein POM88_021629 [Heracleum sosnowskyi]